MSVLHCTKHPVCMEVSIPFLLSTAFKDGPCMRNRPVIVPTSSSTLFSVFLDQSSLWGQEKPALAIGDMEEIVPKQLVTASWTH